MKIKNHLDSKIENLTSYINNDDDELSYDVLQDLYNLTGGMPDDNSLAQLRKLPFLNWVKQPPNNLNHPPKVNKPPLPGHPQEPSTNLYLFNLNHKLLRQGPIDGAAGNAAVDRLN